MKKRLCVWLCVLALLAGALIFPAGAAEEVYFLCLNDSLPPLSAETMPIQVGTVIYIPCTVFDSGVTGISLGVSYGRDQSAGTLTLYSKDRTLVFDLNSNTAYDYLEDATYAYPTVTRNGLIYVPAAISCQFFGLQCSFLSTEYGPLLRIKNDRVVLNDGRFLMSADSQIASRYNQYIQATQSQQTTTPTQDTSVSDTEPAGSGAKVSFAVRVEGGGKLFGLLDALDQYAVKGLILFRPEDLSTYDNEIRRLVGGGHQVGLILSGGTAAQQEAELQQGNELLEHIARCRAVFVLTSGSSAVQTELEKQGCLCWTDSLEVDSADRSAASIYRVTIQKIGEQSGAIRVLLDDGVPGGTLSGILRQIKTDGYQLWSIRENSY